MIKKNGIIQKKEALIQKIKGLDSLLVAFSGGVDSTFLLALAHQVLGERVAAATARSVIHPSHELEGALEFTRDSGIQHIVFRSDEAGISGFVSNGPDRCYHCKKALFQRLLEIAKERGIKHVAHAANMDDLDDYRPGFKAAEEAGIIAPLVDARLNKKQIRLLSKEMGLFTWDKPAMACLATRIPYGDPINEKKLMMVEEAEAFLLDYGFKECRVRHHGTMARIEVVSSEIEKMSRAGLRKKVVDKFREIGFLHIAVDLEGYVSGSMNRDLEKEAL